MKNYILTGNNLKLELQNNKNRLKLIGKNNHIKIVRNQGKIQMVGLNGNVDVKENYGTVEIFGVYDSINIDASSKAMILDFDHIFIASSTPCDKAEKKLKRSSCVII